LCINAQLDILDDRKKAYRGHVRREVLVNRKGRKAKKDKKKKKEGGWNDQKRRI